MVKRILSPFFILSLCLNICVSLPTFDKNLNKKPKLDHPATSPFLETLKSTQQPNSLPPLVLTRNSAWLNSILEPKSLPPLVLTRNSPSLKSTRPPNFVNPDLLSSQPPNYVTSPLLSNPKANYVPPSLLSIQQPDNVPSLLSIQQPDNVPSLLSIQQPDNFPSLLSTLRPNYEPIATQNSKSAHSLLSDLRLQYLSPPLVPTQQSKNVLTLLSTLQPNHEPNPLVSTQQSKNVASSPSIQQSNNVPLLNVPNYAPPLAPQQDDESPILSNLLPDNVASPPSSNQQSNDLSSLLSNQPSSLKSAQSTDTDFQSIQLAHSFLPSDQGQCGLCHERIKILYPDCYQCLSNSQNTKSHEFCMKCIAKTNDCPLCKAPVTPRHQYMMLLYMKSKCDRTHKDSILKLCLNKLLKEAISSIDRYPELRSSSEEIVKHCISNIKDIHKIEFELVFSYSNLLSTEIIDLLIQKHRNKEPDSDYIISMIKKWFELNTKKNKLDIHNLISVIETFGNVLDYSNYIGQAIKCSVESTLPDLPAVTLFITRFGNQSSDHELFYKKAFEASIRDPSMDSFNQFMNHFGLDEDRLWTQSVILNVIKYSFHIKYFKLIEPIFKKYGKEDEFIEYLKLLIENMITYSITTQTFNLIDKYAKKSDYPVIVDHAIRYSIQETKIDVVKFIIYKYGIRDSYKVYVDLAIHASVFSSQFGIIPEFIQLFGVKYQFDDYFETAIMSCLYNSNFQVIQQYRTTYGKAISDEKFIKKTIDLGIRMEYYQGLKCFIKEVGNPLHYFDYISMFESFKGIGKDEGIDEVIDNIMTFYFNE